jgi:phage terminase large subunit-like protein
MLFPPVKPDGIYEVFFRIWIPEENIVRRSRDDKVPYQVWADQGFVVTTSGSTTDFEFIEHDIVELHKKLKFRELGVDKSLIPDMFQRLEKAGIKIVAVEQGMRLSPAIRRTEKLIAEHRFCSFGHPVFNWCARNVSLGIGKIKGDAQLEKEKSRERIDAAAAAVFAVRVAMAEEQPSTANPENFKVLYLDNQRVAYEKHEIPKKPVDPDSITVRLKNTGEVKTLGKHAAEFLLANGAAERVDQEK